MANQMTEKVGLVHGLPYVADRQGFAATLEQVSAVLWEGNLVLFFFAYKALLSESCIVPLVLCEWWNGYFLAAVTLPKYFKIPLWCSVYWFNISVYNMSSKDYKIHVLEFIFKIIKKLKNWTDECFLVLSQKGLINVIWISEKAYKNGHDKS